MVLSMLCYLAHLHICYWGAVTIAIQSEKCLDYSLVILLTNKSQFDIYAKHFLCVFDCKKEKSLIHENDQWSIQQVEKIVPEQLFCYCVPLFCLHFVHNYCLNDLPNNKNRKRIEVAHNLMTISKAIVHLSKFHFAIPTLLLLRN